MNPKMKVLIQNRPDTFEIFGGDSVQTLKTAEHLRKLGVDVDISLELAPTLQNYDIVHLVNVTRVAFTYAQLTNAKKKGKKVLLSPIYWNTKQVMKAYLQTPIFYVGKPRSLAKLGKSCLSSFVNGAFLNEMRETMFSKKLASKVLSEVDLLLPNSHAELEILKHDFLGVFGNREEKFAIITNGVEPDVFHNASPKPFKEKYGLSDFILNVGRFSYRKNQLALIKALKGLDVNVVFIGGSSKDSSRYYIVKDTIDELYYQECKQEADSSFTFLPAMPHEELASAYAACKAFVLPSLYETPGLSALESALAGANVCITNGGSTHEYFSNLAFYCNPNSVDSIRNAVLQAYETPKSEALKEHVLMNFTWDKAAKTTLEAYERVLGNEK
jgi:glycosyltransferase involved in cell wall biosynthesis